VAPRPISQAQPPQATNGAGLSVGGWAVVRYSVLKDGTTANVRVVDAVPPSIDTASIRAAAAGWKFQPGTSDGQAIDWYNGETVVKFDQPVVSADIEMAFAEAYQAVSSQIEAQQFDAALPASLALLNEKATQSDELAKALAQAAFASVALADPDAGLHYLQLATDNRVMALTGEDLLITLQVQLRIETELGRVREALDTISRIEAGMDPDSPNPFAEVAAGLRQHWDNTEFLEVIARIDEKPWRYDNGRRYFYIDNINGQIDSIDAECDTRRFSIEFDPDADYQLPESFGACTLFINGSPGTQFSFIDVKPAAE
jgi:tetratricopeptide (TPR) repeat protein